MIVFGSSHGTIRRWDTCIRDPVGSLLRTYHKGVTSLAIISDGELLVSGHRDGTVRRSRARSGKAVGEPLRGHRYWVCELAVSEYGIRIVSCSIYRDIRPWDTLSGNATGIPLRGHEDSVFVLLQVGTGNLLCLVPLMARYDSGTVQ